MERKSREGSNEESTTYRPQRDQRPMIDASNSLPGGGT